MSVPIEEIRARLAMVLDEPYTPREAREDVAALLAEVDRLRAALERLSELKTAYVLIKALEENAVLAEERHGVEVEKLTRERDRAREWVDHLRPSSGRWA
jgi:hypothetical protein